MDGIVSLLDTAQEGRVAALWAELEREFGLRGVYVTPYPHFSYAVAERYDLERVDAALRRVAAEYTPFDAHTAGLGLFTGTQPVIYVPVVRDARLSALHAGIWAALAAANQGVQDYYAPERWLPHITLAFGDLTPELSGRVAGYLAGRDFTWSFPVAELAIIQDAGDGQRIQARHTLHG